MEKYILQTAFAEIESRQNPLQNVFTKDTPATTADLMFTEATGAGLEKGFIGVA